MNRVRSMNHSIHSEDSHRSSRSSDSRSAASSSVVHVAASTPCCSANSRRRSTWLSLTFMLTMVILIVLNHEWQSQTPSLRLQTQSSYTSNSAAVAISTNKKLNFNNNLPNPEEALFKQQQQQKQTKPDTPTNVKQISILGERHSGTTWIYEHLMKCYQNPFREEFESSSHENKNNQVLEVEQPLVQVRRRLTRYKHWFQDEDPKQYLHDTVVINIFRDPYDWLLAMMDIPHHAPAHMRTAIDADFNKSGSQNDWRIFLTKPWTMARIGSDLNITNPQNVTCQERFPYRDVISCEKEPLPIDKYPYRTRYSEHQPFYEMRNDGSGLPYSNILELRSAKIENFVQDVPKFPYVADVWNFRYEDLVKTGTAPLLERLHQVTGVKPVCDPFPPKDKKSSRVVDPQFAAHVRQHLNWTVEGWIGYKPKLEFEQPN